MRALAGWMAVALAGGALALAQDAAPPRKVQGTIRANERWSGRILVSGDIEVEEGATLEVDPATEVTIAARDETGRGWSPSRVEIHVKGTLVLAGSLRQPIRFQPEKLPPRPKPDESSKWKERPWHGIVLWPREEARHRIQGTLFRGAFAALQLPQGGARIEDCVFLECGMGIQIGVAQTADNRDGVASSTAQAEVFRSRFTGCYSGCVLDARGGVSASDCAFNECGTAVGNEALGYSLPPLEPGSIVDRCTFYRNHTAVVGASVVTESIFVKNRLAIRPTDHHGTFHVSDDHLVCARSLFHENRTVLEQESTLGPGNIFDEPKWSASLDALAEPWPPLPPCLQLAEGSPGRGSARGGDVGAGGRTGSKETAGVTWKPAGTLVPMLIARAPKPAESEAKAASAKLSEELRKQAPAPGAKIGGSWWCAPPLDPGGWAPLHALIAPDARALVAAFVEAPSGKEVAVEVNGDVGGGEGWWNGQPLKDLPFPRRFHTAGGLLKLKSAKSRNLLVLALDTRRGETRLGIAASSAQAQRPGAAGKPLVFASAVIVGEGSDRWLEVKTDAPLNWTDEAVPGTLAFTREIGGVVEELSKLAIQVRSMTLLRAGPLPKDLPPSLLVAPRLLRDPAGATYLPSPKPCRVQQ